VSRAQRRRNTERRIVDAAREVFAERGYERATIRAVAAAAAVDPALVMQYFGTKQNLFDVAIVIGEPHPEAAPGSDQLIESLLAALGVKIGTLPETSLAMIRSMLTHPEAAEAARDRLAEQIDRIAASLPAGADDKELRAALIVTSMLGLTVAHQLLQVPLLRDAPPERLAALLRPMFAALTG
jgi:AcrR family transcriptional regulator